MTPVPLDLPLRLSEAAELADLVFSLAERQNLNDDIRNRVAARAAALPLETVRPYPGSLERDPVHRSAYYLAVDGAAGKPLLLHMTHGGAPTSSIFAKPLLIGRTRLEDGRDIVINAVPFGPADRENLDKFTAKMGSAFLPRPQGSRPAIVADNARAFAGFREIFKATGRNLAALAVPPGSSPADFYYGCLCAAICAGWREGFAAGVRVQDVAADLAPFTRFVVDLAPLVNPASDPEGRYAPALSAAEQTWERIRQVRAARRITRPFDFELDFSAGAVPTSAEDLVFCVNRMRAANKPVQLLAPRPGADLQELAAAARACQCLLTLDARAGAPAAIAASTLGRVNYLAPGEDVAAVARQLSG